MRDKTKDRYTLTGLFIICVLLILGVGVSLFREPEADEVQERVETTEQEVFISTELDAVIEKPEAETMTAETEPVKEEELQEDTQTAEETSVTVPEIETEIGVEENTQELQPKPEKTTEQKPEGAPSEEETPVTEQTAVQETQTAPAHGQTNGNMIYIHGFGWIENHGGGGEGTYAADMYENGNKVGSMD